MKPNAQRTAMFRVLEGSRAGDAIALTQGTCRLVGRHLAEDDTLLLQRDGRRKLDDGAVTRIEELLAVGKGDGGGGLASFDRGDDILLGDEAISRAHAMLFFDPQGVGIVDLASTNGTLVNGKSVSAAKLRSGDALEIGNTKLSVEIS